MWRAIAPAFIAALASTAGAQTVVTRSGEHDSFSRLVMRLPDGVAWSLNQSGQSASLSVDAPAIVFDTSSVFNLIPRTRLQAVTQAGPGQPLQLQLGCECEISTFIEDDGFLVVDIRDGEGGAPRQLTGATLPTSLPLIPGGLGAASGSGYRFNLAARAAADARTALDLAGVISGRTPKQTIQIAASSVEVPAVTQPDPAEQAALSREIRLPVSGSTSTGLNLSSVTLADPKPERSAQQVAAATEVTPAREPQKLEEEPVAVEVNSDLLLDLAENERAATVNASEQPWHFHAVECGQDSGHQGRYQQYHRWCGNADRSERRSVGSQRSQPYSVLPRCHRTASAEGQQHQRSSLACECQRYRCHQHLLPELSGHVRQWFRLEWCQR